MTPAKNIKRLINNLTDKTSAEMDQRILGDVLSALEESEKTSTPTRRTIMKSPITKLAAAAVIIIAIVIGLNQFGGSLDGSSVAWADVVKKIDQVNDYIYRQRQIGSSGPKQTGFEFKDNWETLWYYSSEFGSRWDMYRRDELISQFYVLLKSQQYISINSSEKTFSYRAEQLPQTMLIDPRCHIRQIMAKPHVKLGRKIIDGVMAEGIEALGQKVSGPRLDDAVSRLWVDVETELPIRLEAEGKIHNSDTYARLIQDQFQWNIDLSEADFTPDISADFTQEDWPVRNDTKQEEIVAAYTQQSTEVDFQLLQELDLLGTEEVPAQCIKVLTGIDEIHEARDQVMCNWPSYADLRESLQHELDEKLNLRARSMEELVRIGALLREKFWDAGGCFSPASYRYGYMARVLLELAHARQPHDLTVGDELAEAIMAVGIIRSTEGFSKELLEIRAAQFRQICEEVEAGRKPVWDDFARGCDLAYLSGGGRDPNEAVTVVDWLIQNAQDGGWEACLDTLKWMQPLLAQGQGVGFNIYCPIKPGYPEEFRYGGRPPSFKGPYRRIVVPVPLLKEQSPPGSQESKEE
jgi:hypothetical protein